MIWNVEFTWCWAAVNLTAARRGESSSCSRGILLFDFRLVATVSNTPNWEGTLGGDAAAVEDHAQVEAASSFDNKVPQSADT